jgi:short subunit dehydrogenase-like uncharacterized protein
MKKKLLVIGSTGFVGQRFCKQLINLNYSDTYEITFTARDEKKFNQIFPEISDSHNISFEKLDTFDARAVEEVISGKYVVCNFVGPFAKYAPNIIKACAKYGVHYLDITGEINFIRDMIIKHDQEAKESGASIIPFCGFDSIPSDLGVHLIKQKINRLHNEDLKSAHIIFKAKGGINGGTIASAFDSISTISPEDMLNFHYLCPNERPFFPSLEKKFRKNEQGKYVAPFFMEQINNKVVYRTKLLCQHEGYAKNFMYEESMYTSANFSFASSLIVQKSLDLTDLIMKLPKTSKLVRKILPKPGEGPKSSFIENGFFKAQVIGKSISGKTETIEISGKGDPGNKVTANLVLLSLKCLSSIDKPPPGFQTPISCFGDNIKNNLNQFQLSIKES